MRSLAILTIALAIGAGNCLFWGRETKPNLKQRQWQQRSQDLSVDPPFDTIIEPHSIAPWGDWGEWEVCPQGEYVVGFQLKTMSPAGVEGDNTALNGIRMYCGKKGVPPTSDASITSTVQRWGYWSGGGKCSNGYATGFKLQQLAPQGCGDDMAATDMHLYCSGQVPKINGNGIDWERYGAQWLPKQSCPEGQVITGLRTRVLPDQGDPPRKPCFEYNGDDSTLNTLQAGCTKLH